MKRKDYVLLSSFPLPLCVPLPVIGRSGIFHPILFALPFFSRPYISYEHGEISIDNFTMFLFLLSAANEYQTSLINRLYHYDCY